MKRIFYLIVFVFGFNALAYVTPYTLVKPEFMHDSQVHFMSLALMVAGNELAIPYLIIFYLLFRIRDYQTS